MNKLVDLEKHIAITSSTTVQNLSDPLIYAFGIKHFRYFKLYKNGQRILLSNHSDAIRYMYEQGNYEHMWFDGEFPDFLKKGWYAWKVNRLLDQREVENRIEQEMNQLLGISHGVTFVQPGNEFYEVFSFDTEKPEIYFVDKCLLFRFMLYFREHARKLIQAAEAEKICLPIHPQIFQEHEKQQKILMFLNKTQIKRYYLSGKFENVYLTKKEMACLQALIQGKSAAEIASLEKNQPKTVRRHLENIKLKLNCHKQTELVQIILDSGVLDDFK